MWQRCALCKECCPFCFVAPHTDFLKRRPVVDHARRSCFNQHNLCGLCIYFVARFMEEQCFIRRTCVLADLRQTGACLLGSYRLKIYHLGDILCRKFYLLLLCYLFLPVRHLWPVSLKNPVKNSTTTIMTTLIAKRIRISVLIIFPNTKIKKRV